MVMMMMMMMMTRTIIECSLMSAYVPYAVQGKVALP